MFLDSALGPAVRRSLSFVQRLKTGNSKTRHLELHPGRQSNGGQNPNELRQVANANMTRNVSLVSAFGHDSATLNSPRSGGVFLLL